MTSNGSRRPQDPPAPGLFYWGVHSFARAVAAFLGGVRAEGVEHVPGSGPFLLISNHQSVLDPFYIQPLCPQPVHPMAKSTQFAVPVVGFIMRRVNVFPVRRYRVDPHAVRTALRRLSLGYPVHIYMEGERTWDGGLQPPRPGTVRLALKAGVPIVPCAIDGTYDLWPRWDRRFQRGHVRVAFGPPFRLPKLDHRVDREAALPEAADRIVTAISDLLGKARGTAALDDG
jgi:1-acyl-sn-glycerol-3-phosphate acyltransferase